MIDNDSIAEMENFVRDDLLYALNDNLVEDDSTINGNDKKYFFGLYHAKPEKFRFLPGEKVLLKKISEYLNRCIAEDDDSSKSNQFKAPSNYKVSRKDTIRLFAGTFYGKRTYSQKQQDDVELVDDAQTKIVKIDRPQKLSLCAELYKKSQEKFDKTYPNLPCEKKLTENMVTVTKNGNRITGKIPCIVCSNEKREKHISIQYDAKADGSKYWNFSNLLKHFKKHSDDLINQNETVKLHDNENGDYMDYEVLEEIDDMKPPVPLFETESDEIFQTHSVIVVEENDHIVVEENPDSASEIDAFSSNSSTPNITHDIDFNSLESAIFNQLSSQNLALTRAIYSNSEKKESMEFLMNDNSTKLDVIKAKRDGNCLFSSLGHQIFLHKMNSKDHKQNTLELRTSVVDHIKKNLPEFSFIISGRIQEEEEVIFGQVQTKSNEVTDNDCIEFLDKKLNRPGFYGGTESLKAVSNIHKVNIMIFNELGDPYFPLGFNENFKRSVFIAYRLSSQTAKNIKKESCIKSNHIMLRDHYDSVAEVNINVLLNAIKFSEQVNKKQMTKDVIDIE